jgi:hypothetical protein
MRDGCCTSRHNTRKHNGETFNPTCFIFAVPATADLSVKKLTVQATAANLSDEPFPLQISKYSRAIMNIVLKTLILLTLVATAIGRRCPPGIPEVECFREPCFPLIPPCPEAVKCVDNYCGGCVAEWYKQDGSPACEW